MTNINTRSNGLRNRQKNKRRTAILRGAKALLEQQGYNATTMAKIAEAADVSPPTVFNYFGSKDELITEMVMEGHEAGRKAIAQWQPDPDFSFGQLLAEVMCLYTDLTMTICGKRIWRYAEATNIRQPFSDVVSMYSKIETTHVGEITDILTRHAPSSLASNIGHCVFMARLVYNHWNALFFKYIRDEAMTLQAFKQMIWDDMQQLANLLEKWGDKA